MRKIITLLFCLFLSVGFALADNPIQIRARFSSGEVKPSEEPPIHASINGDMFTATFLENLGSVSVNISTAEGGRVFDQAILCTPNAVKGKCWIVTYPGNKYDHRFFVTGDGYLFKRGSWRVSDSSIQSESSVITSAGSILDNITGIWYTPIDEGNGGSKGGNRHIGISAQEVKEVLPEAVTVDENGLLYLDYDALTAFLIEAVKEQRQEIDLLRKTLEENGLLEPRKP